MSTNSSEGNSKKTDYSHFFSRIKDVHLELPGFSFFHSPSGRFRDNPKMVGRKRVRKKLYGILTNSETKTGSYIITGFRGVGKTSLLNQVINQLQPRSPALRQSLAVIMTWFTLHSLRNILHDEFSITRNNLILAFLMLLGLFVMNELLSLFKPVYSIPAAWRYVRRKSKEQTISVWRYLIFSRKQLFRYINKIVKSVFNTIIFFFSLERKLYTRSIANKLLYFGTYGVIIELVFDFGSFETVNLWVLFIIFSSIVSLSSLFGLLWKSGKQKIFDYDLKVNYFKQKFNHSQKVFVRMSFPQYAISSKDILKSLVHHMHDSFKRYSGFNYWLTRVVRGLIFLIIATYIFNTNIMQSGLTSIYDSVSFMKHFPSQNPSLSEDGWSKVSMEIDTSKKADLVGLYIHKVNCQELSSVNYTTLTYLDMMVFMAYRKVYNFIYPLQRIPILPPNPDMAYFTFIIIGYLMMYLISINIHRVGIATNAHVRILLKELNEKCLAEIDTSTTQDFKVPLWKIDFGFNRNRHLKYGLADAREIENDLIHIFDVLDRVPKIFAPPEFTFVFDELDKIEPRINENNTQHNDVNQIEPGSLESEKTRKKRELVASIMASMKIFFTTAKAKFIFIAGREMYDASLADTSDRESYFGSIFHDIIYVSSLYKDPYDDHASRFKKPIDITYWTERYVCQMLLPAESNYARNMEGYSSYLETLQKGEDKELKKLKYEKVINTVSVFINYLAFRSKGSPMNLFKLFEDFTEEFPNRSAKIFDDTERLIVGKNPKSYYLTFDFQAQYRISFVAGIFRPFVIENGLYLKNFSDKILVSTSYLLDHIYKFHEFGFSWRNLELLPEIIDINRAPLLRRHIENLVRYLADSSLKRIDNGFVNFKFHRKTMEEIRYLSRRSDTESAIFHFTLDESLLIKRHYRQRLESLNRAYKEFSNGVEGFINSITFLESILGDLHFFDKEYDEAVIQYADSVQLFQQKDFDQWSLHQVFLYTRAILKEGLIFERLNTYEPAFTKYSELVEILRLHGRQLAEISKRDEQYRDDQEIVELIQTESAQSDDKSKPGPEQFHFKKSLYENFALMTLPILAKLSIIEKISAQGITLKDSRRADRDFHSVLFYLKKDEKFLLKADYHLKKGDILYYKNGVLYGDYNENDFTIAPEVVKRYDIQTTDVKRDYNAPFSAYEEYVLGFTLIIKKLTGKPDSIKMDDASLNNPPTGQDPKEAKIKSNEYYSDFSKGVRAWFEGEERSFEHKLLVELVKFLDFQHDSIQMLNVSNKTWHILARLLSSIGDCLMIICSNPSLDKVTLEKVLALKDIRPDLSRYELAMYYFSASARCYSRANEIRNKTFQHKKILFAVKSFVKYGKYSELNSPKAFISKYLCQNIMEPLNASRNFIIFPERANMKNVKLRYWDKDASTDGTTPNISEFLSGYYRFSYNSEIKLSIIHYYDLLYSITPINSIDIYEELPFSTYSTISDQMVRLYELRLKSRLNRKILVGSVTPQPDTNTDTSNSTINSTGDDEIKVFHKLKYLISHLHDQDVDKEQLEFLLIDGIFCEVRSIEGINISDNSYIRGYSYLANAYLSLGWWTELWRTYLEKIDVNSRNKCERRLLEMIGSHEINYIDSPEYAYQKALENYYECINMHSEGSTYKEMLSNLYVTEGDLSDDNQHFCAAYERCLINNEIIRRRIFFVKSRLKQISMFHNVKV